MKIFPSKNIKDLYCLSPYVTLEVGVNGDVRLCGCAGWMPTTVGNLFKDTLHDILLNDLSTDIRQSISDGSYKFCNENTCGVLQQQQLNTFDTLPPDVKPIIQDPSRYIIPREIFIAGDKTCNLSCPSCRIEVIKVNEEFIQTSINLGIQLRKNLFSIPSNHPINLHVSTSGELFASPLLMSFVNSIPLDDFPNLTLDIQTNGLLVEKNWHKLNESQTRVKRLTVTIDAASKNTYEELRRGGKWENILSSLTWISKKKVDSNFLLNTRMVVQKKNFEEMYDFYQLSIQHNADLVEYSRISNWGTYDADKFADIDVFANNHYLHDHAHVELNRIKNLSNVFLNGGLH